MTKIEIWIVAICYMTFYLGSFAFYFYNFFRLVISILQLNPRSFWKAQRKINWLIPQILSLIFVLLANIPATIGGYFLLTGESKLFSGVILLWLIIYFVLILLLCVLAIAAEIWFYLFFKPILDLKEKASEALVYSPVRNYILNLPVGNLLGLSGK